MSTTYLAILLTIISSMFGATGGFIFKKSSKNFKLSIRALITNYGLIIGFIFFAIGGVLYIGALTQGELNVLYPVSSLTYVWSLLIGRKYLKEKINLYKWIGIMLIVLGAILITR